MKKIDVGQTVGILANLGVIAGIVFLAVELSQNNALLEAEARSTRLEYRISDSLRPVNDHDLALAIVKERRGEELSEFDQLILGRYKSSVLVSLQHVYLESQIGLIDQDTIPLDSWRRTFLGETRLQDGYWPALIDFWEANKATNFDPAFVRFVDNEILRR